MSKTITFKSIPENFRKEYLNLKRNTVRKCDNKDYIRFEVLEDWLCSNNSVLFVEILNTKTNESFRREVTDVTKWEDFYIISW